MYSLFKISQFPSMEIVTQLINEYIKDPKFLMDAGIVFIILDALQEIQWVDQLAGQYKKLASIVLGALIAPMVIEPSVMGVVAGLFAGASLTIAIDRLQYIASITGGK